ncbi:MAG: universal stress protein [Ferruginibacter sp.]
MSFSFKKILIPVDFTINTKVAIKKAIELADAGTEIHLFYVQAGNIFERILKTKSKYYNDSSHQQTRKKLLELKQSIKEISSDITVSFSISICNSIQKCIEEKITQLNFDLVIIGKNTRHSSLPFLNTVTPNEVAKNTGVTVLTAKPGSIHSSIRTMVVPITTDITHFKEEIITTISRKFKVKIYLVTFGDENQMNLHTSSLIRVYHWIKTSLRCQVEYTVLRGDNKAKAILRYAEMLNADILLVNPKTETKISWLNNHISDMLSPQSNLQVLAVQSQS